MQATFPGVEFLRIIFRFKKIKETSSSYVHVLRHVLHIKRRIRRFHVEVVQWTSKKCTKKRCFFEVVFVVVVVVALKAPHCFKFILGIREKLFMKSFFGGKKRCITGDAKVLK